MIHYLPRDAMVLSRSLGSLRQGFKPTQGWLPRSEGALSMSSPQELDHLAFLHARMERYAYLLVSVFLGYEYLLQFSKEVDLFWMKRWSFGKILFLWSRYYSLAFNIVNAVMFMNEHPSLDFCTKFFKWQNTGAALQVITTHIILEARVYAMYANARWMLCLCIALTVGETVTYGIIFGIPKSGLVATNEPSPGLFICADADPPDGHWITWFWIAILTMESILLSLSLYKGWMSYRSRLGGGLMATLMKDSIFYFVVIFCIYAVNMSFWFVNTITLDEFGTGFAFTISAALANRLLISVRKKFYAAHGEHDSWDAFTSMHFRTATRPQECETGAASSYGGVTTFGALSASDDREMEEYEMDNFSERRGF